MSSLVEVRPGAYFDSVRLMQVGQAIRHLPGVEAALVAMGTELNLGLLGGLGFEPAAVGTAGPDDLIIAVRAATDETAGAAVAAARDALAAPAPRTDGPFEQPPPRTVGTAARSVGANLALISVPGEYAFVEAMDALRNDLHVMVFSDNVPVAQEVALKEEAGRRGLLVMGPDCGTAIVNGVGLGFANVVQPGPVGIAGASGTGIQHLCCLLDEAGAGIRHALGTGGRDLSDEVGGASMLRAVQMLQDDPATELIVVVSKPPAPTVAERVRKAVAAGDKPAVVAFVGSEEGTIEDAAAEAVAHFGVPWRALPAWRSPTEAHRPGVLLGLFAGGTLREEAAAIARRALGTVAGHQPDPGRVDTHTLVDLGEDIYTRGRAHPMIDQMVRTERLAAAAVDRTVGVILLDIVLGHGAHPDPASELAPVIAGATDEGAAVVVSLTGTAGDPQDRDRQIGLLTRAGASVFLSNAAAVRHAVSLIAVPAKRKKKRKKR